MSRTYTPTRFACACALMLCVMVAACNSGTPTPAPIVPYTAAPAGSCHANGALPDPRCTPGATDSRVNDSNVDSTICVSGWSRNVRPPVSVTGPIKTERMNAYGFAGQSPSAFELDHLISLELGGAPDSVQNLWPEAADPRPGFHEKDSVENYLHQQVCQHAIMLSLAQKEIATNWLAVYQQMQKSGLVQAPKPGEPTATPVE